MASDLTPYLTTGGGSLLVVVIGELFRRRRTKADSSDVISDAAGHLVESYRATLTDMRADLHDARETAQRALRATEECNERELALRQLVQANTAQIDSLLRRLAGQQ